MRNFTPGELARLQKTQENAMQHTAIIQEKCAANPDEFGIAAESYLDGRPIKCGYRETSSRELLGLAEVERFDAEFRFARGTDIDANARIKLTHWYGVRLGEPVFYEVVGDPKTGPSGLVVYGRGVTDGT